MKKHNLLALMLFVSICGYAQNTHSISVAINQPAACEGALGIDINASVKVWPNPARSTITLEFASPTAEINIMDASGKIVHSSLRNQSNSEIDVSGLPAGLYHIKVSYETGSKYLNIILK